TAASAYRSVAHSSDPGRETRRLLWEAPDTDVERTVLEQGAGALPLAWQALATGSARDRRAAAALIGWFPDVKSIQPILAALPASEGALTTNQLLFDLNMILLAEGSPATAEDSNALASLHLQWMYDQIANEGIATDVRALVLNHRTIAIFPDRVAAPLA